MKKPTAKVVSLPDKRRARLTLDAFDKMGRERERETREKRAEVERKAREKN